MDYDTHHFRHTLSTVVKEGSKCMSETFNKTIQE